MTLKAKIAPHITEIIRSLQEAGYETYIVGGAVRDFLLDRTPKDYDISTAATPEQIKKVFRQQRVIIIGRRFRLVHYYHGNEVVEISTFRKAPENPQKMIHSKTQHVLPENMITHDNDFGNSTEDAWRRDFTVNAIFYDPVADKIVDFTGMGMADLKASVVRTIGEPELRFEEDPVRMLRALKLVAQYGFRLDSATEKAIHDSRSLLTHASPSRLTLEMEKILKNTYGDRILRAFQDYGLLEYFLPYLSRNWNTPECQYLLELFVCRNQRIMDGRYRDSISLAMAMLALPFVERSLRASEDEILWESFCGIENDIRNIVLKVFNPRCLTKKLMISAVRILMLQPKLYYSKHPGKMLDNPGYPHSRELLMIQNAVKWKRPELPELWPVLKERKKNPYHTGRGFFKKSRYRGKKDSRHESGPGKYAASGDDDGLKLGF